MFRFVNRQRLTLLITSLMELSSGEIVRRACVKKSKFLGFFEKLLLDSIDSIFKEYDRFNRLRNVDVVKTPRHQLEAEELLLFEVGQNHSHTLATEKPLSCKFDAKLLA